MPLTSCVKERTAGTRDGTINAAGKPHNSNSRRKIIW
jgi:hypothetical protein